MRPLSGPIGDALAELALDAELVEVARRPAARCGPSVERSRLKLSISSMT